VKKKLNLTKLGIILTNLAFKYNLSGIEVWLSEAVDKCEVEIYSNYVLTAKITIYDKTICSLLSV